MTRKGLRRRARPAQASILLTMLLLAGCATEPGGEIGRLSAERTRISDSSNAIRAAEPAAIRRAGGLAVRADARLTLTLAGGATRVFADRPECRDPRREGQCELYVLVDHLSKPHLFVVARLFYEGADYLLVDDRSGTVTELDSFPLFSPSGDRLLLVASEAYDTGAAAEIWRRDGAQFVRDWSTGDASGSGLAFEPLGWASETRVRLRARVLGGDSEARPTLQVLSLKDGQWRLEPER